MNLIKLLRDAAGLIVAMLSLVALVAVTFALAFRIALATVLP